MDEINIIAVIVATIAAMVIGFVWYAPPVFGDRWAKIIQLDQEKAKKTMPQAMVVMLIGAFVKAYTLAQVTYFAHETYDHSFMHDALATAFVIWIGFIAVHIITRNVFEQKPFRLSLILLGNELIIFLAMGLIIGAFGLN
jgi:hypothetical protein